MIVLAIHMFSSLPLTSVHCTKCGGMRRWALPIWNVMERQDTTLSADIWIQILYDSSSIWYGEHKTNVYVRDEVNSHAGHEKPLLSAVKRWNLARFRSLAHLEPPPPLFFFHPRDVQKKPPWNRWGWAEKRNAEKIWNTGIKEWTGCGISHQSVLLWTDSRSGIWSPMIPSGDSYNPWSRLQDEITW